MRRFMCEAEVGDEQKFEDPTVNRSARWWPSSWARKPRCSCRPAPCATRSPARARPARRRGDPHRTAHPINSESGGPAGAGRRQRARDRRPARHLRRRRGRGGHPPALAPRAAHAGSSGSRRPAISAAARSGRWRRSRRSAAVAHAPRPRHAHGRRAPHERRRRQRRLRARDYAASFDSVWIDFTQGTGRPGRRGPGRLARRSSTRRGGCKQQMGGAMRQAGIIAAGGVYAPAPPRRAAGRGPRQRPASGRGPGRPARRRLDPATIETNIVFFDLTGAVTAPSRSSGLLARGVRMGASARA